MTFTLPDLPYSFDALEPHIDAKTMEFHHDKHHAGYVAKLNAAISQAPELRERTLPDLMGNLNSLPESVSSAIRNNGGGHLNHTLFWKIVSPDGGGSPADLLLEKINENFDSFQAFKEKFSQTALGVFGSGWAWLCVDSQDNMTVFSTPNQDSPLCEDLVPILGLDVWEHAYYLKYQNRRADYIDAFWHIVAWNQVAQNLEDVKANKPFATVLV